ncbi:MAG: 2-amino-4-hydroxy-6-hydroxymethyldihydropteridine diphosphokinase [Rikenellaceae bacterium]
MSIKVVLLLGGNIGGVEAVGRRLDGAVQLIGERIGEVLNSSSKRVSEAWGFNAEELFVNQAVEVLTTLDPEGLLDATQGIEVDMGRSREAESRDRDESGERYASRMIDIDIILYGDQEYRSDRLIIPHPLMMEREFVLEPMRELGVEYVR